MSQAPVTERASAQFADPFAVLTADMAPATASRFSALLARNLRRFPAGTGIVAEGEQAPQIMFALEGWIALNKSLEDGNVQMIDLILSPDIIEPTSADGQISAYDLHALTDVAISTVQRRDLDGLEISDPPQMWSIVRTRAAIARARVAEHTLRLGQGSAQTRLAYVLLELCLRLGGAQDARTRAFDLPLTQQRIGELAGLSSVHVSRTLRRLSRQGLIDASESRRIAINDIQGLARIAKVELDVLRNELFATDV